MSTFGTTLLVVHARNQRMTSKSTTVTCLCHWRLTQWTYIDRC